MLGFLIFTENDWKSKDNNALLLAPPRDAPFAPTHSYLNRMHPSKTGLEKEISLFWPKNNIRWKQRRKFGC